MATENILPFCPLNHTAHFLPAAQEAPSSLPTALALLLFLGVGAYAVKSLYGRCCGQTAPSVRPPQIVTARPALHRTDTAKRVEIDRAARADWHGTDIKKRVAALRVFGAYLTQGTHSREGIPMIQQAIVSKHEEIRQEGCKIFQALFLQNTGHFEAITSIMDTFDTHDLSVRQASERSLKQLFVPNEILPMITHHQKELRQTYSPTHINLMALKITTIAAELSVTKAGMTQALNTATKALYDRNVSIREQAVQILNILFARNCLRAEIRALCARHQAPELAWLRIVYPSELGPASWSARAPAVRRLETLS